MDSNVVISKLEYDKICRTCLLQRNEMTYLYANCNETECLVEKLMTCTFVKYSDSDEFPKQICTNCVQEIEKAYAFAKKCEKTDKILRTHEINTKNRKKLNNEVQTASNTRTKHNENEENVLVTFDSEKKTNDFIRTLADNIKIENNEHEENSLIFLNAEERTGDYLRDVKEEVEVTIMKIRDKPFLTTSTEANTVTKRKYKTKTGPPFECKGCMQTYSTFLSLKEHQKEAKHKRKDYPRRTCSICSKSVSFAFFRFHMEAHQMGKQYCCEVCGKRFAQRSNLDRHIRIHKGIKPYRCDICDKCFVQSTTLHEHRRKHTKEPHHVCSICGKTFINSGNFYAHRKKHKTEDEMNNEKRTEKIKDEIQLLECEICNIRFKAARTLKMHLLTHGENKISCSACGIIFPSVERLELHEKIHTETKKFSCKICNKDYARLRSLKTHQFIYHTEKKRYTCHHCGKHFRQQAHLTHHIRTHTGEKPYKCSFCDKRFALNGNLTVHIRTHTNETPYLCSVCGKGFYDSSSMKKHFRNHR